MTTTPAEPVSCDLCGAPAAWVPTWTDQDGTVTQAACRDPDHVTAAFERIRAGMAGGRWGTYEVLFLGAVRELIGEDDPDGRRIWPAAWRLPFRPDDHVTDLPPRG